MAKEPRRRTSSPKAPKSTISAVPDKTNGHALSAVPDKTNGRAAAELEAAIRERAYQLYENRGRQHGFAQDDWLQAEAELLGQNNRRTA